MPLMKADQFFVHAVHATADYDAALVLTLLTHLGAAEAPVRSTLTRLTCDTSGLLSRSQAWRATNRLCAIGLLNVRVHPRTWTEYHMDQAALAELVRRAVCQLGRLAGLTGQAMRLPPAIAAALEASVQAVPTAAAPQAGPSPDPCTHQPFMHGGEP